MDVSDADMCSIFPKFIPTPEFCEGKIHCITAMDLYKNLSIEEIRFAVMNYCKINDVTKKIATEKLELKDICLKNGSDTEEAVMTSTQPSLRAHIRKSSKSGCENCKLYSPEKNISRNQDHFSLNKELDTILIYEVLQKLRNLENKLNKSPKMVTVETQTFGEYECTNAKLLPKSTVEKEMLSEFEDVRSTLKRQSNLIASLSKVVSSLLQDNLMILENNQLLNLKIQNLESKFAKNSSSEKSEDFNSILSDTVTLKSNVKTFISELNSMFSDNEIGKCFSSDSGVSYENYQEILGEDEKIKGFNISLNENIINEQISEASINQYQDMADTNLTNIEIIKHCPKVKKLESVVQTNQNTSNLNILSESGKNVFVNSSNNFQELNSNEKCKQKRNSSKMPINSDSDSLINDNITKDTLSKNLIKKETDDKCFTPSDDCNKSSFEFGNNFCTPAKDSNNFTFDTTESLEYKNNQLTIHKGLTSSKIKTSGKKVRHGNISKRHVNLSCFLNDNSLNNIIKIDSKCKSSHLPEQTERKGNEDVTLHVILREKNNLN